MFVLPRSNVSLTRNLPSTRPSKKLTEPSLFESVRAVSSHFLQSLVPFRFRVLLGEHHGFRFRPSFELRICLPFGNDRLTNRIFGESKVGEEVAVRSFRSIVRHPRRRAQVARDLFERKVKQHRAVIKKVTTFTAKTIARDLSISDRQVTRASILNLWRQC